MGTCGCWREASEEKEEVTWRRLPRDVHEQGADWQRGRSEHVVVDKSERREVTEDNDPRSIMNRELGGEEVAELRDPPGHPGAPGDDHEQEAAGRRRRGRGSCR